MSDWADDDVLLLETAATELGLLSLLGAMAGDAPSVSPTVTARLRRLADRIDAVSVVTGEDDAWGAHP